MASSYGLNERRQVGGWEALTLGLSCLHLITRTFQNFVCIEIISQNNYNTTNT